MNRQLRSLVGPGVVFALLSVIFPAQVVSQCPGSMTGLGPNTAHMSSSAPGVGAGQALYDFIGAGCTATKFGPSTLDFSCKIYRTYFTSSMFYALLGLGVTPSANNTSNGCNFHCPSGSCTVRGSDGLPVELMEFAVEEWAQGHEAEGPSQLE